jgi:helix-turn-helix protein
MLFPNLNDNKIQKSILASEMALENKSDAFISGNEDIISDSKHDPKVTHDEKDKVKPHHDHENEDKISMQELDKTIEKNHFKI